MSQGVNNLLHCYHGFTQANLSLRDEGWQVKFMEIYA